MALGGFSWSLFHYAYGFVLMALMIMSTSSGLAIFLSFCFCGEPGMGAFVMPFCLESGALS